MLMGRRAVHCGGHGAGQAAKLANNLVLAVTMAGVAEGLALGRRLGLDPALLSDVFDSSSAQSWVTSSYSPCPGVMEGVPSSVGYRGGFASVHMVKDLLLALRSDPGAPLPMTKQALQLYEKVTAADPALDFSAIYEVYGSGEPGK
jgi:3-hydroxyisobutyrate dehydrogenase